MSWYETTLHFFEQYGMIGLFILAFVEASFFPIPPYLLFIPMTLRNPGMGLVYAAIGVVGSVMGGLLGYSIGFRVGRPLLAHLLKQATLAKLENQFSRYGGWAIAIGGVTPIPYKIFTIAAGTFRVRVLTFIPASIIARSIRFFGEALLLIFFGQAVVDFLEKSMGPGNLASMAALVVLFVVFWKVPLLRKPFQPLFRRSRDAWIGQVNHLRQVVEPVGYYGWYLVSGATLVAFGFLLFFKLVDELLEQDLYRWDSLIGHSIVSLHATWLTPWMSAATNLGSTTMIVVAVLAITALGLQLRRVWLDLLTLNVCVVGALLFTDVLKVTFHRPRPPLPWMTSAVGFSFPSGHSLITGALYWCLAYLIVRHTRWSAWRNLAVVSLLCLPILTGISRVYLGVHYPSDVLAGWSVAAAWVGICVAGREILRRTKR